MSAREDPRSVGAKTWHRQGPPVKSCSRQRRLAGGSQQPAPQGARSPFQTKCLVYDMSTMHM
eukprot:6310085-Prymnesium_polylepis.1